MKIQESNIEALINSCKQGAPAAQKELVRRFAASLLSVTRRYVRNPSEAEDILQDAFIMIFNKIATYDPDKGAISTWMRRVVINTALAHYRRFRFQFETTVGQFPDQVEMAPDVLSKISFDEIMNLVNDLPEGTREVFNLSVFDAFSHDEIAEILQIPAGTSRSLLSRARKLLQEKILKLKVNELANI